jgi:hypothetical protein
MKRGHTVLVLAILALPVAAGGDRPTNRGTSTQGAAFSAGQVLTLDASGKITNATPQMAGPRAALGEALSTSSEGLVEEKSPVAGGGVMVNLQGRFQNAMTIAVDENGTVAAPCITGTSEDEVH